jgi:hypothetical protein
VRMAQGSRREPPSTQPRWYRRVLPSPILAAIVLSLFGFLAVGLAGAGPAMAADPTMAPLVPGQHLYDNGKLLSATSVKTAETLASDIEAEGGGRVVVYTAASDTDLPGNDTLASRWFVDGLLLTATSDGFGQLTVGATLKGKLTADQASFVADNSSNGPATPDSWITSTLARVHGFLSGTYVFDGAGILDGTGKQKAEAAAKDLSGKIGAPVYIDIAVGGDSAETAAFFNGAGLSDTFSKSYVIALAVSDKQIGGYIDSGELSPNLTSNDPWSGDVLSNETAANGDVQAALLAAIDAIQQPPLISSDMIPVIIFIVVVVLLSLAMPFIIGPWLIRKLTGATGPIKGGLPGDAIIESIADTGVTVSMPGVGPDAPEYKFGLQVTPAGGGAPYQVETKALVPRIYIPMAVPGASVGVLIDPTDPQKVSIDFSQMGRGSAAGAGAGAGAGADGVGAGAAGAAPGGMDFNFDASGQPAAGDVNALIGAVRSGALPTIKGSADQLLATGTHGTAVITTAQPMGKTVRDINPAADPSRLDDPMWLFTVEVSVAGEAPFPAVFGHRVPLAKVVSVAPGVKLAIAVNMSDRNQEVAIDWDKSPIS